MHTLIYRKKWFVYIDSWRFIPQMAMLFGVQKKRKHWRCGSGMQWMAMWRGGGSGLVRCDFADNQSNGWIFFSKEFFREEIKRGERRILFFVWCKWFVRKLVFFFLCPSTICGYPVSSQTSLPFTEFYCQSTFSSLFPKGEKAIRPPSFHLLPLFKCKSYWRHWVTEGEKNDSFRRKKNTKLKKS